MGRVGNGRARALGDRSIAVDSANSVQIEAPLAALERTSRIRVGVAPVRFR
jgi:hypothetical protein